MCMSARKWSVALAVLMAISASASARDNFSNNPSHNAFISLPQLMSNSATRSVGNVTMPVGLQSVGIPASNRGGNAIDPSPSVGRSLDISRPNQIDRADRGDRLDRGDRSDRGDRDRGGRMDRGDKMDKVDTAETKSDTSRKETKIAANTADDSPSQQPPARAITPPVTCR